MAGNRLAGLAVAASIIGNQGVTEGTTSLERLYGTYPNTYGYSQQSIYRVDQPRFETSTAVSNVMEYPKDEVPRYNLDPRAAKTFDDYAEKGLLGGRVLTAEQNAKLLGLNLTNPTLANDAIATMNEFLDHEDRKLPLSIRINLVKAMQVDARSSWQQPQPPSTYGNFYNYNYTPGPNQWDQPQWNPQSHVATAYQPRVETLKPQPSFFNKIGTGLSKAYSWFAKKVS